MSKSDESDEETSSDEDDDVNASEEEQVSGEESFSQESESQYESSVEVTVRDIRFCHSHKVEKNSKNCIKLSEYVVYGMNML